MLAYVSKYRSLTITNDNSKKRFRSLQKILELYPNISRHLDGELRRHLVSRDFMSSPPVIGGSEESVAREEDRRISNEELRNRHTLKRKTSTSHRGLASPMRSSNDIMIGLRRRNTDKPRRRSDSTTTSSTPSKRDLTKPMMELQRINKARRFLEDVKRIAENWIYMLKQVEEVESIFTAELMERVDADSDDLSDSESSKTATLERPKSGTLILSKDYNLERYALPGIHLPKSMVRLFYEYWKKNIQNKDEKMSFSRFMLYFPYKTQEDIANLVVSDTAKFEELCNARISQGFGVKAVTYYETAKQRAPYRVRCDARAVQNALLRDAKGNLLDTKHLSTTMSGRGVGMLVFRRPSERESEDSNEAGIFVHIHRIDKVHHSSIFAGGAVDFAGEIKTENGKILWISNKSGHYKPGAEACLEFLHFLTEKRVDLKSFHFDVVKKSIEVDILRRVCPDVSSIDRGRGSYWRIPTAHVMYEGLLKPSLWNESYASHLRQRFSPVILQKIWRGGALGRRWKWCAHMVSNILRLVQRGMIAVDSYEACVIDKIKLAETITEISIGYLRLTSGGTRSLLANVHEESNLRWYYKNDEGNVKGPLKSAVVYIWMRRGKLKPHVEVSCHIKGPYRQIGDLTVRFVKLLALRDIVLRQIEKGKLMN